jgi:ABC-type sugar transport system ATPase subunit
MCPDDVVDLADASARELIGELRVPVDLPSVPGTLLLRGVRREYGATIAVDAMDLDLPPARVHALLGENGAGKSTVAQIAAGVVSPTAGSIVFDDDEKNFRTARDAEACGIVFIPQELRLYDALTVAENMYVGRPRPRTRFGIVDGATMRARAKATLDRLGSTVRPAQYVEHLTPANRQMVAIARALMIDVRVLIMDEPTAALDEWEAQRLLDVVDRLRTEGVAVLYVSHRMHEVSKIADDVTVMRDGKQVASGPAGDFTHEALINLMVGRNVILAARDKSRVRDEVRLATDRLCRRGEFEDVSIRARSGEVVGIAGIVGSGRSEFAQALFGYTRPTSGSVEIDGNVIAVRSVRAMIGNGVGYLPEERQSQGLFSTLSVSDNVSIAMLDRVRRGGLLSTRREHRLVSTALEPLRLRGGLDDPVGGLSGGNQQKVLLARWLAVNPRVLILDEPTRGIDVGTRAEIYRIIDDLTRAGVAVVLISSDLQELLWLSDRIMVMRRGRIVAEFGADEMSELSVGGAALGAVAGGDL